MSHRVEEDKAKTLEVPVGDAGDVEALSVRALLAGRRVTTKLSNHVGSDWEADETEAQ